MTVGPGGGLPRPLSGCPGVLRIAHSTGRRLSVLGLVVIFLGPLSQLDSDRNFPGLGGAPQPHHVTQREWRPRLMPHRMDPRLGLPLCSFHSERLWSPPGASAFP